GPEAAGPRGRRAGPGLPVESATCAGPGAGAMAKWRGRRPSTPGMPAAGHGTATISCKIQSPTESASGALEHVARSGRPRPQHLDEPHEADAADDTAGEEQQEIHRPDVRGGALGCQETNNHRDYKDRRLTLRRRFHHRSSRLAWRGGGRRW